MQPNPAVTHRGLLSGQHLNASPRTRTSAMPPLAGELVGRITQVLPSVQMARISVLASPAGSVSSLGDSQQWMSLADSGSDAEADSIGSVGDLLHAPPTPGSTQDSVTASAWRYIGARNRDGRASHASQDCTPRAVSDTALRQWGWGTTYTRSNDEHATVRRGYSSVPTLPLGQAQQRSSLSSSTNLVESLWNHPSLQAGLWTLTQDPAYAATARDAFQVLESEPGALYLNPMHLVEQRNLVAVWRVESNANAASRPPRAYGFTPDMAVRGNGHHGRFLFTQEERAEAIAHGERMFGRGQFRLFRLDVLGQPVIRYRSHVRCSLLCDDTSPLSGNGRQAYFRGDVYVDVRELKPSQVRRESPVERTCCVLA